MINGSWLLPGLNSASPIPEYANLQTLYDEIYENGVTACFGAGNGRPLVEVNATNFIFPASFDYNISVSTVGFRNTTGTNELANIHEFVTAGDSSYTHQHNTRVDICAPGVGVPVLEFHRSDTVHAIGHAEGTSFASPMVAGTAALLYSKMPCLSPYQMEFVLKNSAYNIYTQPYNGNLYNMRYLGRLGAGRVDAGAALNLLETFECNDPATQTMVIEGVTLTNNCSPGLYHTADTPRFKIGNILNGRPPYRYLWTPLSANDVTIDDSTSSSPKISNGGPGSSPIVYYRLAVYDNSEIQKVASIRFMATLHTDSVSDLAMRDSYFDMLDEKNTQFDVNHNHFDIWHSPDLWNRDTADGGTEPQDPEVLYDTAPKLNTIYIRVKNVGCAQSAGEALLRLYWTYSSTGEKWKADWDGTTTPAR